jgi:hypothetical protein
VKAVAPIVAALAAVAAVVVPYLALGGASFEPTPVANPCLTREWRDPGGLEETLEQIALSALDGAACDLGVSREDLVLALEDDESLDEFAEANGVSRDDTEQAIHDGLVRAVDDAEEADALSGFTARLVRAAVERIPPNLVLEALEQLRGVIG